MAGRHAAAILALGLLLASCGGDGAADDETTTRQRLAAAANGRLTARPAADAPDSPVEAGVRSLDGAMLYVPRLDGRAPRLVVTLHGAGGSARAGLELLRPLADEADLLLLAPKSQGTTWDVGMGGFGPDVAAIDELLEQVFEDYPIEAIAVAGFSDGASYALSLGLTNGDVFDAVIAFSPGFIAFAEQRGMPALFISHGTEDSVLPIGRTSRRGVPRLRAAGYRVKYREFHGEHEVPPRIAREAVAWLQTSVG